MTQVPDDAQAWRPHTARWPADAFRHVPGAVRWLAIISLLAILSGCVRYVEVPGPERIVHVYPAPVPGQLYDVTAELINICIIPQDQ